MESGISPRVKVQRHAERGNYDPGVIHAILDEAFICHVGFVVDGRPVVLPTIHARIGDDLYVHGAAANAMIGACDGRPVCVEVSLLDGLVLARSVYNHSLNYRSVVVFGEAREVRDEQEKLRALTALVEHVLPGRSQGSREPSPSELLITRVLRIPISEASAKVRQGQVSDAEKDMDLPYWAGVVPLHIVADEPEPDPALAPGIPEPDNVRPERVMARAARRP